MNPGDPFAEAALRGTPLINEQAVDIHAHVDCWSEPEGRGEPLWPRSALGVLDSADRLGIRHLIFSHLHALRATVARELEAAHADSEAIVLRSKARLSAHLVLHPYFPRETSAWLERLPTSEVFVGAKLHGELHDVRLQAKQLTPLLERCESSGLSLLVHLHPAETVADIAAAAQRFPRLNFILAHLRPRVDRARALFADHPNLHTDMSLSYGTPGMIEEYVQETGADRVLYGSDAAYLSMGAQFTKLALTRLPTDTKRRIFSANSTKVFPRLAKFHPQLT